MNNTWFFPTLFLFDEYAIGLAEVCKEKNIKNPLKYTYGTLRSKWSFNYDSFIKFEDRTFIEMVFSLYNKNEYIPVINFSNTDIIESDLEDGFCNYILEIVNQFGGELIIASDILYDYVKNKYPDMKLISSVNLPINMFQLKENDFESELRYYNSLIEKYDKVIVRPEFIGNIKNSDMFSNPEKVILIPNNACKYNCQHFNECRNILNNDYICCRDREKAEFGIEKSFENISMLTQDEIKNLSNIGLKNFMLKDNKQTLIFLYTVFNYCLFDEDINKFNISRNVRKKIIYYMEMNKFIPEVQNSFFSGSLFNKMSVLKS